jgi:hypothetical protein
MLPIVPSIPATDSMFKNLTIDRQRRNARRPS